MCLCEFVVSLDIMISSSIHFPANGMISSSVILSRRKVKQLWSETIISLLAVDFASSFPFLVGIVAAAGLGVILPFALVNKLISSLSTFKSHFKQQTTPCPSPYLMGLGLLSVW